MSTPNSFFPSFTMGLQTFHGVIKNYGGLLSDSIRFSLLYILVLKERFQRSGYSLAPLRLACTQGLYFTSPGTFQTCSSLFNIHLTQHHPYSWYKRSEMGSRIALFFSSATVAGAFSQFFLPFSEGKHDFLIIFPRRFAFCRHF